MKQSSSLNWLTGYLSLLLFTWGNIDLPMTYKHHKALTLPKVLTVHTPPEYIILCYNYYNVLFKAMQ